MPPSRSMPPLPSMPTLSIGQKWRLRCWYSSLAEKGERRMEREGDWGGEGDETQPHQQGNRNCDSNQDHCPLPPNQSHIHACGFRAAGTSAKTCVRGGERRRRSVVSGVATTCDSLGPRLRSLPKIVKGAHLPRTVADTGSDWISRPVWWRSGIFPSEGHSYASEGSFVTKIPSGGRGRAMNVRDYCMSEN